MAKNLGQIAGLFIGTTAPVNKKLVWFDNTPSQNFHKIYNFQTSSWEALDKYSVIGITYSELVTLATTNGLTNATYYKITDKSNILAIAITSTKIQYVDSAGNIVIDDLGTNQEYIVSANNLVIDDVNGVFNSSTKKVVFSFTEQFSTDLLNADFVLFKGIRNSVSTLLKIKFTNLISGVVNNSIQWNRGFFFNFKQSILNITNQANGIVGYDKYLQDLTSINSVINQLSDGNQIFQNQVIDSINEELSNANVFAKQLPDDLTPAAPTDITKNDSLFTIVNKIQRYINSFKKADGIQLTSSFAASNNTALNNNDTVDSALRKVVGWINYLKKAGSITLSSTFTKETQAKNIIAGDDLETAIKKIAYFLEEKIGKETDGVILSQNFLNQYSDIVAGTTSLTSVLGRLFYDENLKINFEAKVSTVEELLEMGNLNVKSIIVKKGVYNITYNVYGGTIIDCDTIITNNTLVYFEPGVTINVNSTVSGTLILFGGVNLNGDSYINSGKWIGNGCKISASGSFSTLEAFKYVANLEKFVLVFGSFAVRASYCWNMKEFFLINPNVLTVVSYLNCSYLINSGGRFSGCSYISKSLGYFNNCFQLLECQGTKGTSVPVMLDSTPVSNTSAGGWNSLT